MFVRLTVTDKQVFRRSWEVRECREIHTLLAYHEGELLGDALRALAPQDLCDEVLEDLERNLADDLPLSAAQGGILREGAEPRVDELRKLASSSKDVLLALEERERKRTGISSLKIRYTRVFGYYIEITRSNLGSVPSDYRRKQTIANGERYVTDELEELERKIETADVQLKALEQEFFDALRKRVAQHASRLFALAGSIADLDVHASFAEVAHRYDYVRPTWRTRSSSTSGICGTRWWSGWPLRERSSPTTLPSTRMKSV